MTLRFRLPLLALALSLPVPALAQSAQDFTLPPAPTPTASPQVQGPVDTESGVVPVRPRVIATATPTPRPTPTPAPVLTPEATITAPATATTAPRARPTAGATPQATTPARSVEAASASPDDTPQVLPPSETAGSVNSLPQPTAAAPSQSPSPAGEPLDPGGGDFDWTWLAALLGVLAVIVGGFFVWRRRQASAVPPAIEKPVVAASPKPAVAVPAGDPLTIRLTAEKLTRSAMFATLKYRLTLVNRTDAALTDVTVGTDLVSAHSGAPMEQQVATAATPLETRHTLARIAPRQNVAVEGEVKLPLGAAQVIMQGRHPLLVPLMRVRVDGAGDTAVLKTFVVGQGQPDGGRVQPFRLDEPPRSYAPIAQRELA